MSVQSNWNIEPAKAIVTAARKEALTRGCGLLLAVANRTVPIDEGTLLQSGFTDVDSGEGVGVVAYDTPYAVRLHENPQYHFQHGRRGKWLSLAMGESNSEVERLMADTLRGMIP